MPTKYFILMFIIIFVNNAVGEESQIIFRTLSKDQIPEPWKAQINKMFSEKLDMEINLLKNSLEKRYEQNSIKKLENYLMKNFQPKLETSLENKIVKKLEENLRIKLEGKLAENLTNKLRNTFEGIFEKKQRKLQKEEWIYSSLKDVKSLSGRAVEAGYEPDGSPLWITRAFIKNNLIPGKLNVNAPSAYYAFESSEYFFKEVSDSPEVLCAPPERVRWLERRNGVVPPNAVVGGHTVNGEKLYIGRAREQGSLTPGQVHPSDKVLYISFNGKVIKHNIYEVLCLV